MSILNLEFNAGSGGRAPRNKRAVKVWIGIGLVAAVLGVGSTLASTITLNNGGTTEFGQGFSTTVSCAGGAHTVSVTPISAFDNTSNEFYVGQVKVTGIPAVECAGVDFAISLYDNAGSPDPILLTNTMRTAHVWFANNCPVIENTAAVCDPANPTNQLVGTMIWYALPDGSVLAADNTVSEDAHIVSDVNNGTFTITLPYLGTNSTKAADLGKIVIETQPDQNGFDFWSNTLAVLS